MWGCCECIATPVQVLMKLVTVCRRGGDGDLDQVTLIKLVFLPGQQLVDWFPIQQQGPEPAEEPVWLGDGDGECKEGGGPELGPVGRRPALGAERGKPNTTGTNEEIGQKQISSPPPGGV